MNLDQIGGTGKSKCSEKYQHIRDGQEQDTCIDIPEGDDEIQLKLE